jgi:hypothetical protein
MKKIVGYGNINDTFLCVIKCLMEAPDRDLMYYHCYKDKKNKGWISNFLGLQKIKHQIFDLTIDEMIEYGQYDLVIREARKNKGNECSIKQSDLYVHERLHPICQEFLKKNKKFVAIQMNDLDTKEDIWTAEELKIISESFENYILIGNEVMDFKNKRNFTNFSVSDSLQFISKAYCFIGIPGAFSYYAGIIGKQQLILGDSEAYYDNWNRKIFETKELIIDKIKHFKYE